MKKIVVILIGALSIMSCKTEESNPKQFTLTGEIKGLTGNLFFRHPDKEYTRDTPADTIHVVDGKINFSDTISELNIITAYTDFSDPNNKLFKKPADGKGYFPTKSMLFTFFAFPGADIKVSGEATDFMNAYPSGDEYNNSLAAINKIAYPNYNTTVNLAVQATHETDSLVIQEINKKAEELSEEGRLARIKFVEENPNTVAAMYYLNDLMLRTQIDNDKAIEIFNSISKEHSGLSFYKTVESRINGILNTAEGSPVPAIKTTSTLDGKEFDITSLRGKYVLIDFWGIWCGPCVAEMPQVKAFQEKYKDKLVVLGINSGDTKEKVQKFVEEHGYGWQQVMSVKENSSDNFVTGFNVQGFPTKFIIDPRGKIVKRYLGSGEEAFALLEELLRE
ncbi:TlpA family protein disulfide reductase [Flavobacteriaceae bacterium F08102]|nr:TlpA family protein disulfide reductase [Flavobacteriaceae bacterium F08102]